MALAESVGCAATPEPRQHAQVAFFVTDEPIEVGARWVDRGFFVAGGVGSSSILTDAWVYDVGAPEGVCPWLLHSAAVFGDGAGGVARGAMAYLPDTEQLLIAGGVVDRGAYQASTMEVRLLNLASGGAGRFTVGGFGPPDAATVTILDDPFCASPTWPCDYYVAGGWPECWSTTEPVDACTGALQGSCGAWAAAPAVCAAGPTCEAADLDVLDPDLGLFARSALVDGLADSALIEGASGAVHLFGGVGACSGACPESWAAVLDLGHDGHAESAHAVGSAGRWDLVPSTGSYFNAAPAGATAELRADLWPPDASVGLRGAAGVSTGLDWDPSARRWVAEGVRRDLLFGGTSHQDVSPQVSFSVLPEDLTNFYPQCPVHLDVPVTPAWVPLELLTGFEPYHPALVVDPSASAADYVGKSVTPGMAPRVNVAATRFDADAVVLYGGEEEVEPGWFEATDVIQLVDVGVEPYVREDVGSVGTATVGGAVVTDPFTRRAWAFGGNLTDAAVWSISHRDTVIEPNGASTFEVLGMEQEIAQVSGTDLASSSWEVRYGYRLAHHCAQGAPPAPAWASPTRTDRCFADRIVLEFRDQSPGAAPDGAERASAVVEVRFGGAGAWYPAEPIGALAGDEDQDGMPDDGVLVEPRIPNLYRFYRSYRVPRTLADGDQLDVRVALSTSTSQPVPAKLDVRTNQAALSYAELGDDATQIVYAGQALARPTAGPMVSEYAPGAEQAPLWRTHLLAPDGAAGIAPGGEVPCEEAAFELLEIAPDPARSRCLVTGDGASRPFLQAILDDDDLIVLFVAGGLDLVGTIDGRISVWADPGLSEGVRDDLVAYVSDPLPQQGPADLAWLEATLGPLPASSWVVVATRPPADAFGTPIVGVTFGGLTWLQDFGLDGELDEGVGSVFPHDWRSAMLHELAHAWFGYQVRKMEAPDADGRDTTWVIEGMPSLLSTMRYPQSGGRDEILDNRRRFARAVNDIVWSRLKNDLLHRVEHVPIQTDASYGFDDLAARVYTVAPYLLSQLAFTAAATDADTPDPMTSVGRWTSVLAGAPLRELTRDLVKGYVDSEVAGFWDAWLDDANSVGIPLVGPESLVVDGVGVGTLTVRQWQVDWLGWPAFSDVPYVLGCAPEADPGVLAFDACTATETSWFDAKPATSGPAAPTFERTLSPDAGTGAYRLAVLSGPSLLPGVSSYSVEHGGNLLDQRSSFAAARTWMTVCNGDTTGRCDPATDSDVPADGVLDDFDHDGHPDWSDCRRDSASPVPPGQVYFLAPEEPVGASPDQFTTDANCDGWPTPLMVELL
ncbi:MAG: hypothetical protein ABMA64_30320 [Myxococcota bacterium]